MLLAALDHASQLSIIVSSSCSTLAAGHLQQPLQMPLGKIAFRQRMSVGIYDIAARLPKSIQTPLLESRPSGVGWPCCCLPL